MLVDCDTCAVRGPACAGCSVHALLTMPAELSGLTDEDQQAIEIFARAGFDVEVIEAPAVQPLRLLPRGRNVA